MYRREHGWLMGWLRMKMGVSVDRAADLTQDTFVRVMLGAPVRNIHQPRSYLATIARGLAVDFFRRQDLEQAYLDYLATCANQLMPSPEEQAMVLETLLEIDAMLQGLGPKVRQAFLLSQLDGLSYSEIAQSLQVSVSSVKKYMAQAVEQCLICQQTLAHARTC
jgi:RNA polymerase sigma factor (sigma-70 family)